MVSIVHFSYWCFNTFSLHFRLFPAFFLQSADVRIHCISYLLLPFVAFRSILIHVLPVVFGYFLYLWCLSFRCDCFCYLIFLHPASSLTGCSVFHQTLFSCVNRLLFYKVLCCSFCIVSEITFFFKAVL